MANHHMVMSAQIQPKVENLQLNSMYTVHH